MLISSKKLIGLRVETKSGYKLGRVKGFEADTETLEIKKIHVRPNSIVKALIEADLVISKSLVISVDEKKMIVDDLVERELKEAREKKKIALEGGVLSISTSSTEQ
ncbi:MAG: hypothetical protein WC459_03750 [Patescibacteria group bacterium]